MGRPVNKKFFGDPGSPGYQIACQAYFTGGGAPEPAYIVSQRSNSVYIVTDDGTTNVESLRLVEGAPAEGEMQVVVSPVTGSQLIAAQDETDYAVFTAGTDYTAGDTLTLSNGGTVTVDTVDVGGEVLTFTVATTGPATAGQVLTATGGTGAGFTLTVAAGNLQNSLGTPESARIINQHTVKTFEDNVYSWRDGVSPERPLAIIGS